MDDHLELLARVSGTALCLLDWYVFQEIICRSGTHCIFWHSCIFVTAVYFLHLFVFLALCMWHCLVFVALSCVFGTVCCTVVYLWHCRVFVALWCVCGAVVCLWHCGVSVALSCVCGTVVCLWRCRVFVALWCVCGAVVCLWHCGVFVALWCVCGTVVYLWHCRVFVALWCVCGAVVCFCPSHLVLPCVRHTCCCRSQSDTIMAVSCYSYKSVAGYRSPSIGKRIFWAMHIRHVRLRWLKCVHSVSIFYFIVVLYFTTVQTFI